MSLDCKRKPKYLQGEHANEQKDTLGCTGNHYTNVSSIISNNVLTLNEQFTCKDSLQKYAFNLCTKPLYFYNWYSSFWSYLTSWLWILSRFCVCLQVLVLGYFWILDMSVSCFYITFICIYIFLPSASVAEQQSWSSTLKNVFGSLNF